MPRLTRCTSGHCPRPHERPPEETNVTAPKPQPELLPPFGRETALRVRGLTKTEEEETIIINRSDRSTYPDEKSVLRSGATPHVGIRRYPN